MLDQKIHIIKNSFKMSSFMIFGDLKIRCPYSCRLEDFVPEDASCFKITVSFSIMYDLSNYNVRNYHVEFASPKGMDFFLQSNEFFKENCLYEKVFLLSSYDYQVIKEYLNSILNKINKFTYKQANIYMDHYFVNDDLLDLGDIEYFKAFYN